MRRLAALVFPGFEVLDLFGPLEMFGLLGDAVRIDLVAEVAGPVISGQGVAAVAGLTLDQAAGHDLILVPGGMGTRAAVDNAALTDWIAARAGTAELTLGVCTGSALMARAGVLDGRRATTNKAAFRWVVTQGPRVTWIPRARWVEDGLCLTSSGVSAGMDMALAAIGRLYGDDRAEAVAGWAEYVWNRDPEHDPFAARHGLG